MIHLFEKVKKSREKAAHLAKINFPDKDFIKD